MRIRGRDDELVVRQQSCLQIVVLNVVMFLSFGACASVFEPPTERLDRLVLAAVWVGAAVLWLVFFGWRRELVSASRREGALLLGRTRWAAEVVLARVPFDAVEEVRGAEREGGGATVLVTFKPRVELPPVVGRSLREDGSYDLLWFARPSEHQVEGVLRGLARVGLPVREPPGEA